jgi:hypothetical protein
MRIVAAGLLFEAGELWYELRSFLRDRIRFFRYRIVIVECRVQTAKMVAFVSWFLIIVGVITEWASEVRVKAADVPIQECSEAKLSATTVEASLHSFILSDDPEQTFPLEARRIRLNWLCVADKELMVRKSLSERTESTIDVNVVDNEEPARSQSTPRVIQLKAHIVFGMPAVVDEEIYFPELTEKAGKPLCAGSLDV